MSSYFILNCKSKLNIINLPDFNLKINMRHPPINCEHQHINYWKLHKISTMLLCKYHIKIKTNKKRRTTHMLWLTRSAQLILGYYILAKLPKNKRRFGLLYQMLIRMLDDGYKRASLTLLRDKMRNVIVRGRLQRILYLWMRIHKKKFLIQTDEYWTSKYVYDMYNETISPSKSTMILPMLQVLYTLLMHLVYKFRCGRDGRILKKKIKQRYMPLRAIPLQLPTNKCFYTYRYRHQRRFLHYH